MKNKHDILLPPLDQSRAGRRRQITSTSRMIYDTQTRILSIITHNALVVSLEQCHTKNIISNFTDGRTSTSFCAKSLLRWVKLYGCFVNTPVGDQ
jgi:hypothetical protein